MRGLKQTMNKHPVCYYEQAAELKTAPVVIVKVFVPVVPQLLGVAVQL